MVDTWFFHKAMNVSVNFNFAMQAFLKGSRLVSFSRTLRNLPWKFDILILVDTHTR